MSQSTSSTLTPVGGSTSYKGYTQVKTEHITYEWIIKDFKFLPHQNGKSIYSPIFRTDHNDAEWKLCLFPRGRDKESADWVAIFLHLHSLKAEQIKIDVHFEISILPSGIARNIIYTYEKIIGHGHREMIQRSELLKSCGSDNTVTIRCKMDLPGEIVTEPIDQTKCMEQVFDSEEGQLSQDFHLLYKESKFTDVTVMVGTEKFRVHKLVLAARSPVFSAMFEHEGTQENIKNEVKIEEMEPNVVEAMLEFFYTDEVKNLEELAYELLEAANKYDIQRLRSICEKVLFKTLNEQNAAVILSHADLHRSHKLKERVLEFMTHHLVDVVESESYKEMEDLYPALVKELMRAFVLQQKSKK